MRRANGSGTVKKLGGKRRKPWACYRPRTYDENGNGHMELIGTYETKKEAEIALAADFIRPHSEYEKFTLSQIWEKWSRTRSYTQLSKSGQQGYYACYRYYMDDFHDKQFRSLRRDEFQLMVDKADDAGKSTSTMTKIRALCSILSEYAMSLDIIQHSYAKKIIVPKHEKGEILTFSSDEIDKLKTSESYMAETILILIYTGMRISELLAIKISDIDFEEMTITGGCKTDAGRNRIIPIHRSIAEIIESRKNQQCLVEYNGKPYSRIESFRDHYYKCLDSLGIRRLTPHKARHTFFSMLDASTQDKLAMAIVGGHTDPSFTEQIYVHPDLGRLRAAVDSIK